jgi:hypothetical protein
VRATTGSLIISESRCTGHSTKVKTKPPIRQSRTSTTGQGAKREPRRDGAKVKNINQASQKRNRYLKLGENKDKGHKGRNETTENNRLGGGRRKSEY